MAKSGFERYFFAVGSVGGEHYRDGRTVNSEQITVAEEILKLKAVYLRALSVDDSDYLFAGCFVTRQNTAQPSSCDSWNIKITSETKKGLERAARNLQLY